MFLLTVKNAHVDLFKSCKSHANDVPKSKVFLIVTDTRSKDPMNTPLMFNTWTFGENNKTTITTTDKYK